MLTLTCENMCILTETDLCVARLLSRICSHSKWMQVSFTDMKCVSNSLFSQLPKFQTDFVSSYNVIDLWCLSHICGRTLVNMWLSEAHWFNAPMFNMNIMFSKMEYLLDFSQVLFPLLGTAPIRWLWRN